VDDADVVVVLVAGQSLRLLLVLLLKWAEESDLGLLLDEVDGAVDVDAEDDDADAPSHVHDAFRIDIVGYSI